MKFTLGAILAVCLIPIGSPKPIGDTATSLAQSPASQQPTPNPLTGDQTSTVPLSTDIPKTLTSLTDLHTQLELGQLDSNQPMEVFMNQTELTKMIKLGGEHTMMIVRPRNHSRFMLPDQSYRLFCKKFDQWTDIGNLQWANYYKHASNLIAYGFFSNGNFQKENLVEGSKADFVSADIGNGPELICQLVDSIDQTEANCLLKLEQRDGSFPVIEIWSSTQYFKPNQFFRDSLPGTYCQLISSGA